MIVRPGTEGDLEQINEIYNHYILTSHCTFDLQPHSMSWRRDWFRRFSPQGRQQLFIAADGERVAGYASSGPFRDKAAYQTSVETSVYVAAGTTQAGIGSLLYDELLPALEKQDVHRAYAGIALPNDASIALHERFGFRRVALFTQQGRKFDQWWDVAWYERAMG